MNISDSSSDIAGLTTRVRTYWNERIHDLEMTTQPVGTRAFFEELDDYRFDKLAYLPRVVDFGGYKGKRLVEVGCGVGTDLVGDWYRFLPAPYLTELRQFLAAGFSVPEVLVAATRTGAELLDLDDKLGTLAPGKLADVLVVEGRPDERIDDLLRVDLVIRDGEVVVEKGRLSTPRHLPVPEPTPRP